MNPILTYKASHVKAHIKVADAYASLSHSRRLKVGAYIIRGDTPIAHGWNGTLPGEPNACEDENNVTLPSVRHAEINALNKLRRSSEKSEGAIIVQTHAPCAQCALDLIDSKILGLVFVDLYREPEGINKLVEAGMSVYRYDKNLDRFFHYYKPHNGTTTTCVLISDVSLSFRLWY